jgi:hypothetical protein
MLLFINLLYLQISGNCPDKTGIILTLEAPGRYLLNMSKSMKSVILVPVVNAAAVLLLSAELIIVPERRETGF